MISSWLLDLTAMALTESPTLSEYEGYVQDSGEGRWTIQAAVDEAVPVDVFERGAVCAFPLAAAAHLRGKNAFRHAAEIWRTR